MMQLMDLSKQASTVAGNEISGDNIGNASVNPAPNGRGRRSRKRLASFAGTRPRDLQIGEEVPVSGFADCLLNPVVVGPPRVRSLHLECIGRWVRECGTS